MINDIGWHTVMANTTCTHCKLSWWHFILVTTDKHAGHNISNDISLQCGCTLQGWFNFYLPRIFEANMLTLMPHAVHWDNVRDDQCMISGLLCKHYWWAVLVICSTCSLLQCISHDLVLLFIEQLLTVNNPRAEMMQLFIHSENSPTVKSVSMVCCIMWAPVVYHMTCHCVSHELLSCVYHRHVINVE